MTRIADVFAESSACGLFARWVGSVLCVGLPVVAARIWWSPIAAIVVFVVTVTAYVTVAVRHKRGHNPQS
jgi:hypothetical protein